MLCLFLRMSCETVLKAPIKSTCALAAPAAATNSLLSVVRHLIGFMSAFIYFYLSFFLAFLGTWALFGLNSPCFCLKQIKISGFTHFSPSLNIFTFFFLWMICFLVLSLYGRVFFYSLCSQTTSKTILSPIFLSVFTGIYKNHLAPLWKKSEIAEIMEENSRNVVSI